MFPPLRRHIRLMRPERAGKLWLARLHELMTAFGDEAEAVVSSDTVSAGESASEPEERAGITP